MPSLRAPFTGLTLLFALAALLFQFYDGAFLADRGNHGDEAAHFVSSLAIADYIRAGLPANPVAFATDYYIHFPKLAIGHWPPLFELVQALAFLIFGHPAATAIILQAVIAALCAAIPAALLWRQAGIALALMAGFAVLLSPVILPMSGMVMADNLLALLVTLAALSWAVFYRERSWRSSLLFALAASAAILTKGSALGLAFLPLIHAAFRRDIRFLFSRKALAASALVALLCGPWYALTYRMAADGFVFQWGWNYTSLAAPFFLAALPVSIGFLVLAGFAYSLFRCAVKRQETIGEPDIAAFAAAALAMTGFAMIAPADLDPRYLIPALPSIVLVGVWSLSKISTLKSAARHRALWQGILAAALAASILLGFRMPHLRSYRAADLVQDIRTSGKPNPLVLVSGSVPAEGAFISTFAVQDRARRYYVIRAQKALAVTNWMASDYRLRFSTPAELAQWIAASKIGWIVLDEDSTEPDFPHNLLLKNAIGQGLLQATAVAVSAHPGGEMTLYALPAAGEAAALSDTLDPAIRPGHLEGHLGGLMQ